MVPEAFATPITCPTAGPDRQPPDPAGLPRQRRGITPQRHGRYPDYDVLADAGHWDPVTRERGPCSRRGRAAAAVLHRAEFACLCAFSDVVLAQDAEPRIPVMSFVDAKLADGRLDGFQHVDMPDDRDTWRHVAQGLDEAARQRGATSFAQRRRADAARDRGGVRRRRAAAAGSGTGCPSAPRGRWSCARCCRRSTRTRGRGTRSASAAPPTRAATCASPRAPREPSRDEAREAFGLDPVKDVERRGMP